MDDLIKRLRERRTLISMNGIQWHPSEVPDADCIEAAVALAAQAAEIERLKAALKFIARHVSSDWPDRCRVNVQTARAALLPDAAKESKRAE